MPEEVESTLDGSETDVESILYASCFGSEQSCHTLAAFLQSPVRARTALSEPLRSHSQIVGVITTLSLPWGERERAGVKEGISVKAHGGAHGKV